MAAPAAIPGPVERRGRSPEPPGERALLMLGGAFGGGEFHWCGDPWDPGWRARARCSRCSPESLTARRFFAGRDLAWEARRKAVAAAAPPSRPAGNGMATAGLVLAIVAFALAWVPLFNVALGGPCWVLGTVFSAIGWGRSGRFPDRKGRGLAIAGVAVSVAGVAMFVWAILVLAAAVGAA